MKAIIYNNYGSPDVLRCEEIEKPTPGEDDVLIRVHAASVNPFDWHFIRGTPYFIRMLAGLCKPKDKRLGHDVAGVVEAVGRSVTQFRPGDEVFGICRGAFAEYACASKSTLATKPGNVPLEQAACVGIAALTALQAFRDKGHIQAGQRVLVNGAAGGVGTFAVQIAKSFGADVTGVCSTRNVGMVRSLGADRVIDYTREDFTKSGQRYDLFLDCVVNHSLLACRNVLNPKGTYVEAGGGGITPRDFSGRWMAKFLARSMTRLVFSPFVSQNLVTILARPREEDLTIIGELMKTGTVTAVIDRRYRLSEVPEAIRYLEEGHARGKVVITLELRNNT